MSVRSPSAGGYGRLVLLILLAVSVLWLGGLVVWLRATALLVTPLVPNPFEAITSYFAALAVAGTAVAIYFQSRELQLQRRELRKTTQLLRMQTQTLSQQRFETTFFNLLAIHQRTIAEFTFETYSGPNAMGVAYRRLASTYERARREVPDGDLGDALATAWQLLFEDLRVPLSRYFRSLYTTLRLMADSDVSDLKPYVRILRAQLTDDELLMIMYNCVGHSRGHKMKALVEQFHLLDNMPKDKVLDPLHMSALTPDAFL